MGARLTHQPATTGNAVRVLTEGHATYDAIAEAIDGARHHVHAQYYLIRDDASGRGFRDRLVAAAKRGVSVRLLVDGFGCFRLRRSFYAPLLKAGARVGEFLPMRSVLLQPVNLRNHRKIVVVDGETAFTGGFNVGDEYRGGTLAGMGTWRDVHLRIEGPAAADLQRVFFQDWAFATGEPIEPREYFARDPARPGERDGRDRPERARHAHRGHPPRLLRRHRGRGARGPRDDAVLRADGVAARGDGGGSDAGGGGAPPAPGALEPRGDVPRGPELLRGAVAAGVEVREYVPGLVHAKTLVADGQVALVGSANMDLRSFRLNFEVHALVHDATTATVLRETFDAELADSRRIEVDAWRARRWSLKLREGAARLVSPLLDRREPRLAQEGRGSRSACRGPCPPPWPWRRAR